MQTLITSHLDSSTTASWLLALAGRSCDQRRPMFGLAPLWNTSGVRRSLARMGGRNSSMCLAGYLAPLPRAGAKGRADLWCGSSKRRCVPLPGRSLLVAVALDLVTLVFLSPEHT